MHGGLSTGPRTPEGLERSLREAMEARRRANWETVELAKRRFERESRLTHRRAGREVRRLARSLNRLL
jgi:hypothetical protein